MKRLVLLVPLVALALLAGCAQDPAVQGCTEEARICPDGTSVVRVPPTCEFEECPSVNDTPGVPVQGLERRYISDDSIACETLRFTCEDGEEAFFDSTGCGCEAASTVPEPDTVEETLCEASQRDVDACIALYQPVCGWFDPDRVQCIKYPCAQTYSNSCFACDNPDVISWTPGECPA